MVLLNNFFLLSFGHLLLYSDMPGNFWLKVDMMCEKLYR